MIQEPASPAPTHSEISSLVEPNAPLRAVYELLRQNKLEQATRACKGLIRSEKYLAEGLYLLGLVCHAGRNARDAEVMFAAAITSGKNDPACLGAQALVQGKPTEALPLLQQALVSDPHNVEAALLRSDALNALEQYEEAVQACRHAVSLEPGSERAQAKLYMLLIQSHRPKAATTVLHAAMKVAASNGRIDNMAAVFRDAIAAMPDDAFAHIDVASSLLLIGKETSWRESLAKARSLEPDSPRVLNEIAIVFMSAKDFPAAIDCLDYAVSLRPDEPALRCNLGNAYGQSQQVEKAVSEYRQALALQPDFPECAINLAGALMLLRQPVEAAGVFRTLVAAAPKDAVLHARLAAALQATGQYTNCREELETARRLQPDDPYLLNRIAITFNKMNESAAALTCLEHAVTLRPEGPRLRYHLGNTLVWSNQWERAICEYQQALVLKPQFSDCALDLGILLSALGRPEEAITAFRQSSRGPHDARALFGEAETLLRHERLHEGFAIYAKLPAELRGVMPDARYDAVPMWTGAEDVDGKTVLLHTEQGIGDTVQFCRFIPVLAARGVRVVVEVPALLLPLLRTLNTEVEWVAKGEALPPLDFRLLLMSLPHMLNIGLQDLPGPIPYLHAPQERIARWTPELARLSRSERKRIGIAWSGRPDAPRDATRSMPLSALLPLRNCDCDFFVIQKGIRKSDREALTQWPELHDLGDKIEDPADTAAVIHLMDYVISACTSPAHVAGAIGKPVSILLSVLGDWRWMHDRSDTPWYPTANLIRQQKLGDWDGVVKQVAAQLETTK